MLKRVLKHLIVVILFSAIPAFLSYAANSPYLLEKMVSAKILGSAFPIDLIQNVCFVLSIILSTILLSCNLFLTQMKYDDLLDQRGLLIRMTKDNLRIVLSELSSGFSDFDIRFFIPRFPKWYYLCNRLHLKYKREFAIKNIDIIANQGATKNLRFEVFPNPQGLVGQCYRTKNMVYDDMLEKTNATEYSLTAGQISRTSNLKWSICCPIIDTNDEVVAIVAFDGTKKIHINRDKQKELSDNIFTYTRMLYDAVPQLFRR